jgi:hypothetical protein
MKIKQQIATMGLVATLLSGASVCSHGRRNDPMAPPQTFDEAKARVEMDQGVVNMQFARLRQLEYLYQTDAHSSKIKTLTSDICADANKVAPAVKDAQNMEEVVKARGWLRDVSPYDWGSFSATVAFLPDTAKELTSLTNQLRGMGMTCSL